MSRVDVAILAVGVEGLAEAVAAGFAHVEVEALEHRPAEQLEALADAGVFVACGRLGGGLHVEDITRRRAALARLRRQIDDCARLGARRAYLSAEGVVGANAWAYFTEGCHLLADQAAGRMMELAVGPVPGGAAWVGESRRVGLRLAVEGEDVAAAGQAGGWLTYVRRPGRAMEGFLLAAGYAGHVAVELHSPQTSSRTSSAT